MSRGGGAVVARAGRAARAVLAGGLCALAGGTGCASSRVPDPQDAARAYGEAAARGDADALYGMMNAESRRARSLDEVRAVVAGERAELAEQGVALEHATEAGARVTATARLRYADGEEAALDLRQGRYGVTAAGALPGGGRTPEEALDQLRRVLARRSYAGLMRLLSPATRAAVEN